MSRRERGKDARRLAIISAARKLIQKAGNPGFTMQQLADAADVSLATPYNLFGSKQAIMVGVLDADLEQFEERLSRSTANDLRKIFKVVSLARKWYEREENFYRCVFTGIHSGNSINYRKNFRRPRLQFWSGLVENAIESGHLRNVVEPQHVASNIVHIFYAVVMDWLSGDISLAEMEAEVQLGIALLLLGIATEKGHQPLLRTIERSIPRAPTSAPQRCEAKQ